MSNRTTRRGPAASLALALTASACGSRTSLPYDGDRCFDPAETLACSTACGEGVRRCVEGLWQPCDVPPATRTCDNDCGQGTARCTAGAWTDCDVPVATRECSTLCGTGHETCASGQWQGCDAPRPSVPKLKATARDFHDTHPDFERNMGSVLDLDIVEPTLGPDDKPVYAGHPTTPTTSGKYYFDTWYRDTAGINLSEPLTIPLTQSPTKPETLVYDNNEFFPLDGMLFGNEGRNHNFHFTVELAVKFRYSGGETFRFTGDDDIWVFVNRHLAINLGGLHSALSGSIDLDAKRQAFDLEKGGAYPLNVFFAERHTSASTFHIETTVADWDSCD